MNEKTRNRVVLKGIKVLEKASLDSLCFEASLYFDGKRVAIVSNDGWGGCHRYDPIGNDRSGLEAARKWADAQTIVVDCSEYEGLDDFELKDNKLDHFVDERLAEWEDRRFFAKGCKGKTMFRLKGDPRDRWFTVNAKWSPEVKAWLDEKYGDKLDEIANETRI